MDLGSQRLRYTFVFELILCRVVLVLVRRVLVCMCFEYVLDGVLGVGLSMCVVLGLAPHVCGVVNI